MTDYFCWHGDSLMHLRDHFKASGLTQDEIAERTGLSQSTISRLSREDDPVISADTAFALLAGLNIPLTETRSDLAHLVAK
jgi:transcriptional regulator with XRE-family HTH domain